MDPLLGMIIIALPCPPCRGMEPEIHGTRSTGHHQVVDETGRGGKCSSSGNPSRWGSSVHRAIKALFPDIIPREDLNHTVSFLGQNVGSQTLSCLHLKQTLVRVQAVPLLIQFLSECTWGHSTGWPGSPSPFHLHMWETQMAPDFSWLIPNYWHHQWVDVSSPQMTFI